MLVLQVADMGDGMEDKREMNVFCCLARIYVEFNNQAIAVKKCQPVTWASRVDTSFWMTHSPCVCVLYVFVQFKTLSWGDGCTIGCFTNLPFQIFIIAFMATMCFCLSHIILTSVIVTLPNYAYCRLFPTDFHFISILRVVIVHFST